MSPQLLDQLSGTLPAGGQRAMRRTYLLGMGLSFTVALLMAVAWLGVRRDLLVAFGTGIFWLKLLFPLALAGLSLVAAAWSSHPGVDIRRPMAAILVAVLAYWAFALVPLLGATPQQVEAQLWGKSWRECPVYITLIALPLMVPSLLWLRQLGPVAPRTSGALVGFFCGTLAAALYSLHCQEAGLMFLGVWYLLGALIPAAIGALLGRWLLAW